MHKKYSNVCNTRLTNADLEGEKVISRLFKVGISEDLAKFLVFFSENLAKFWGFEKI